MVQTVTDQATGARALADITDQTLLTDPRTNPQVRGHHDRLRDDQQRSALNLEHRRQLRRGRVADRRASHAEATLEAITAARQALSPARAVVTLQRGRRRFLAGALAASVALSIGSAIGLAAISVHTGGPALVGYVVELCLTVSTTFAILFRAFVDQASIADDRDAPVWEGWRELLLVALVVVPMSTSVVVNMAGWVAGAGVSPLSALSALGAGAAAGFAYLIADVTARAVRANARVVDGADEDALRAEASGSDLFDTTASVVDTATQVPEDDVPEEVDEGAKAVAAIEDWLEARGADGQPDHRHTGTANGSPNGTETGRRHTVAATRHFDPDLQFGGSVNGVADGVAVGVTDDGGEAEEKVVDAVQTRRLQGAATRLRVAEHLAVNPDATARQIADALGIGESTARRHKRDVEADDGGEG
ncbi:hypothetical protein [Nocardiopsis nanhaiensis]